MDIGVDFVTENAPQNANAVISVMEHATSTNVVSQMQPTSVNIKFAIF
jgi:hypothetical protein